MNNVMRVALVMMKGTFLNTLSSRELKLCVRAVVSTLIFSLFLQN
jgi:hypothetical protein